jgi:hypothetical protein
MVALIVGVVVAVLFLGLLAAAVVVGVVLAMRSRRSSLVPRQVRRAINEDLDRSVTKRHVDDVKRDWLKADGWSLEETE